MDPNNGGCLWQELVAAPDAASAARTLLTTFLHALGWSSAGITDMKCAVSEAVTNAAEHAYPPTAPGTITLRADVLTGPNRTRRVCVRVSDRGRWNPHPAHRPDGRAGMGLRLMRATTAHLTLQANASGTCVTMISDLEHPHTAL